MCKDSTSKMSRLKQERKKAELLGMGRPVDVTEEEEKGEGEGKKADKRQKKHSQRKLLMGGWSLPWGLEAVHGERAGKASLGPLGSTSYHCQVYMCQTTNLMMIKMN